MKSSDTLTNANSEIDYTQTLTELPAHLLKLPGFDQALYHQIKQQYGSLFNVALIEPEIPQNTGNIGRTCVGLMSSLHLVGKKGFEITDKNLKRAGLDYWPYLTWEQHADFSSWQKKIPDPKRVFYFTTKTTQTYWDPQFQPGDWFVFGKETKGLPEDLLRQNPEQCLTIPQIGPIRSLNVATAVAIVLYEAYRQLRPSLKAP
jgi:tRNA (cytidine/uridine-2'-O-)-methyltransferase